MNGFDPVRASRFLSYVLRHDPVHLSADPDTAIQVGARRGTAVVLQVDTAAANAAGHPFWLAANGVWLTDHVPPAHLRRRPTW